MEFKTMIECMNENCRTVILAKNTDGLRCVRCGGRTRPMPFASMKKQEHDKSTELTIQVNADTTEALKGIKEVTEAANECVVALEKLERLTNKFSGFPQTKISVHADTIAQRINSDTSSIRI